MAFVDRANFPSLARPEAHLHRGSDLVRGSVTADQLAADSVGASEIAAGTVGTSELADAGVTAAKLANEAWLTWSPTLANLTLGNGTQVTKYVRLGRTVHYVFLFKLESTSAVGTGPTFSLPVAPAVGFDHGDFPVGHVSLLDGGTAVYLGQAQLASGTTVNIRAWAAGGTYVSFASISATVPFTWGAGDAIMVTGTYEAAS